MAFQGSDGPFIPANTTWTDVLNSIVPGFPGQTFQNVLENKKIDAGTSIQPSQIHTNIGATYGDSVDTFMRVGWPVIASILNGVIGTGDVTGPGSATNHAIARFDGTTGKLIENSLTTLADNGSITMPALATIDGRDIDVDGVALDAHLGATGNVHSTTFAQILTQDNITGANDIRITAGQAIASTAAGADGVRVVNNSGHFFSTLSLDSSGGGSGAVAKYFVGTAVPTGAVTGVPGSFYLRVNGTSSQMYQHRGASSSSTGWVEFGAVGAISLGSLSDVTLTSLVEGNLLHYNGTGWVNANIKAQHVIAIGGNTPVGANVGPYYETYATKFIPEEVVLGVNVATASDLEVDVLSNGVTIFAGVRPKVTTGNTRGTQTPLTTAILPTAKITIDIVSGGTTWEDLTVHLQGRVVAG